MRLRSDRPAGKIILMVATLACLLTSCASAQPLTRRLSSSPVVRDAHLLGMWHVLTIEINGQPVVADSNTTASLQFRRDGLDTSNCSGRAGAPAHSQWVERRPPFGSQRPWTTLQDIRQSPIPPRGTRSCRSLAELTASRCSGVPRQPRVLRRPGHLLLRRIQVPRPPRRRADQRKRPYRLCRD